MRILTTLIFISSLPFMLFAHTYPRPNHYPSILGHWYRIIVKRGDSLGKIAKRTGVSLHEIYRHNAGLEEKKYIQPGRSVLVPNCYWLPVHIKAGEIVINIATQTMFYAPKDKKNEVNAYPVTVGKAATSTPTGNFYIKRKKENPIWYPPASIKAAYKKRGIELPFAVGPGPRNPLGPYAIYLNKPTYLIHTAPSIRALGGRQSFGCIRMYPNDIISFYHDLPLKTKVRIVDIPLSHEDSFFNHCSKAL